jgi:hypothetical protein
MKEVEKKDLPEVPGGVQPPYPGGSDVGLYPRFPGIEELLRYPVPPIDPPTEPPVV